MTYKHLTSRSPKFNIGKIEAEPMTPDSAIEHVASVMALNACNSIEAATKLPGLKENTESIIATHLGAAEELGFEELFLSSLANLTGHNWLPNVTY